MVQNKDLSTSNSFRMSSSAHICVHICTCEGEKGDIGNARALFFPLNQSEIENV